MQNSTFQVAEDLLEAIESCQSLDMHHKAEGIIVEALKQARQDALGDAESLAKMVLLYLDPDVPSRHQATSEEIRAYALRILEEKE